MLAHWLGAYIGEVLRREYGGHWAEDHELFGPKAYPLFALDQTLFPVAWCGKRIFDGEAEDVWYKYQVLTSYKFGDAATEPDDDISAAN